MALSRGLSLWLYPAATQTTPPTSARDYRQYATSLEFTTVAPGGFGTLTVELALGSDALSRPELQLFALCALKGMGETIFAGEISEIALSGDGPNQAIQLTVLGVGNCLRDDPSNFAYSAKTALQIIDDQFGYNRSSQNYPISFDESQIFPDNPATSFTLSYSGRSIEDILNDLCTLLGGYVWCVWDHPTVTNSQGFHVGRIEAHIRDTSTTHYIAAIQSGQVAQYSVTQSSERAYNLIQIDYNTAASGAAFVTSTDSRLNPSTGAINIAPFRRRKYYRSFAGNSAATQANAQTVSDTLLAQYKNGGNKIALTLNAVRDNNGTNIPLYMVRADKNIHVPDMAFRGATLPTTPTATVNQFYIIQTTYRESQESAPTLELSCDNYFNNVDVVVARLQLEAERRARTGDKKTEMIQGLGAAVKQWASGTFVATASSQLFSLQGTTFRPILAQAPTSISWAAPSFQTLNTGSPSTNNINQYGFHAFVTSTGSGAVSYGGSYTTVGNCIYDLDLDAGTFTHHHGACGLRRERLSIKDNIIVEYDAAGAAAMRIECLCGGGESYNLNLGHLREREGEQVDEGQKYYNTSHDAEQARHIRALMRHPHVGLHRYVRDCQCEACDAGRVEPVSEQTPAPKKPRARRKATTPRRRQAGQTAQGGQAAIAAQ